MNMKIANYKKRSDLVNWKSGEIGKYKGAKGDLPLNFTK